jgi:hypothetical protein
MAGLAVGLISGRREVIAALAAVAVGVGAALLTDPAIGVIAGGVAGPIIGMLVPVADSEPEVEVVLP